MRKTGRPCTEQKCIECDIVVSETCIYCEKIQKLLAILKEQRELIYHMIQSIDSVLKEK